MSDRNVFEELIGGFADLETSRQGKKTLRTTEVPARKLEPYTPNRLVSLRERLGYSQPVFARLLHINPATLKNWEQGKSRPNNEAQILLRLVERQPELILSELAELH